MIGYLVLQLTFSTSFLLLWMSLLRSERILEPVLVSTVAWHRPGCWFPVPVCCRILACILVWQSICVHHPNTFFHSMLNAKQPEGRGPSEISTREETDKSWSVGMVLKEGKYNSWTPYCRIRFGFSLSTRVLVLRSGPAPACLFTCGHSSELFVTAPYVLH